MYSEPGGLSITCLNLTLQERLSGGARTSVSGGARTSVSGGVRTSDSLAVGAEGGGRRVEGKAGGQTLCDPFGGFSLVPRGLIHIILNFLLWKIVSCT